MDLRLASHRAIFKALQAFEDGELALTAGGPLTAVTTEGELRFLDGVCFAAPRADWIGAELVGWLEELDGLSGVGAWWRPGLRPVLRGRNGRVTVASGSQDLLVAGAPASSGFATHSARFIVAHGEPEAPARAPAPLHRPAVGPVAASAPGAGDPVPAAAPLRERGEWRSTAVVPWTLGQGRPVTRGPREPLGPLPPVAPPPPRPQVYTPVPRCVRMVPRALPPPCREVSSQDRLSRVA